MAPLTKMTGSQLALTDKQRKAFITADTLLCYPDPNLPFHIYTDATEYQFDAAILQNEQLVGYYSHKMNQVQCNYTTMEKELLRIVQKLKEHQLILYGAKINFHAYHQNLISANLNLHHVIHWHLFSEEFHPQFHYITVTNNMLAETLLHAH